MLEELIVNMKDQDFAYDYVQATGQVEDKQTIVARLCVIFIQSEQAM